MATGEPPWHLRPGQADDAAVLAAYAPRERTAASLAHSWAAALANASCWLRVVVAPPAPQAADGARLVAAVHLYVVVSEAEVVDVWVAPQARRRGHARRLLAAAMQEAAACGVHAFFLQVARANGPARALYHALGFAEIGVRLDYYRNEPKSSAHGHKQAGGNDAICLRKILAERAPSHLAAAAPAIKTE